MTKIDDLTFLKFEILASGLQITQSALLHSQKMKRPIRTRSGVSGGLDIILPCDIHVNAPIGESYASNSPLCLDYEEKLGFFISRGSSIETSVKLQPTPLYYEMQTSQGKSMQRIGQMCSGDRFCYGMTGPYCRFWKKSDRCQYCSIGYNNKEDASRKKLNELIETLEQAINDQNLPAKHILLGGGTPNEDDMGAKLAAQYCREIKKRFDISIYVMIAAPLHNNYIDELYDSGADELGMNMEFWSEDAWKEYIPGKHKVIGKKRYLEALNYAVKKFGPINTRSIFVAGLEKAEHTIEGALHMASIGVMPIISPFRPLEQTMLQHKRGFTGTAYFNMYQILEDKLATYDIPLGPTCIACQNNVLAVPKGRHYKFY